MGLATALPRLDTRPARITGWKESACAFLGISGVPGRDCCLLPLHHGQNSISSCVCYLGICHVPALAGVELVLDGRLESVVKPYYLISSQLSLPYDI